jgi:uncharacterized protein (UPF0248 family)
MATAKSTPSPTTQPPPSRPLYRPSRSIESLRALAQSHLREIADEVEAESSKREARNLQLQLYAKPAHLPRPPQHQLRHQGIKSTSRPAGSVPPPQEDDEDADTATEPPAPPPEKLPPLRTASDVLNRLRHDPEMNVHLGEYVIGYLERFDGMLEMPVADWVRESTHEEFIPQHRIRYIIRRRQGDDELVWGRDERIDRIWGSGKS